jgi:hypothetical protein
MQLVVGSCLVTRFQKFMVTEKERLGIVDDDVPAERTATEAVDERV